MNLAVKYRPSTFEDVVGQDITTKLLQKSIETGNLKNCYLFSGTSGCGKTTCARIFAKAINGGIGEPIEKDAASENGVDNVRAIMSSACERSIVGLYKVFIIDEAHMITQAGWNAFLKGIEETPKYTIFIFCTTNPNKIPNTILNRLQRFTFTPISPALIYDRLKYICEKEGFTNYEKVCETIAHLSNGEMRNAVTYLDQVATYSSELSMEVTKRVLSGISYASMFELTWALTDNKEEDIIQIIDNLFNEGCDLKNFISVYLDFVFDLIKFKMFNNISLTDIPPYLADTTTGNTVVQFTVKEDNAKETLLKIVDELLILKNMIRNDTLYKSTIEVSLLKIARTLGGK